ncbi:TIGR03118 family protein [Terriglobus saanensis]|uniref:TIGR03118 family protein n=1 Tax=Terriglobus saanensis (strain ATCC BAA-1853 / DSM 23119 / SP1PR4) TaxID=401053 RepID=E8V437_TERSS|nr:TIGR03118 family protein [Terriglobus saanensis]ADV82528.1 hypothetical protein AciPR4_1721 [Terriglobus saanensis SP1PR4]
MYPRMLLVPSLRAMLFASCIGLSSFVAAAQTQSTYLQTNLISDGFVPAAHIDSNLKNPWGLSIGQDFWTDSPGSGLSIVTDATGTPSFDVTVPAASGTGPGTPAGTVFNSDTTAFTIPLKGSATFLFGTLDGTIAAWNASTPTAVTVVNNSAAKAVYTDIVVDKNATGTFLLAANFSLGTVDVFDTNFAAAHLTGAFADPDIPAGYAPFGIHSIGSNVYVTYAQVDPTSGREVVGAGLGYVNVFDNNGNLLKRAISQGNLNAPWGMALAPSGFGSFGGDLLIGNFGDGIINVYDPNSFALLGQLTDASGNPIANTGLWEIVFGTGTNGAGDPNTLYLAAGINGEQDGVVATITVVPPSAGSGDFSIQPSTNAITVTTGQNASISLALTGTNGFTGPVAFSCTGLPSGSSCVFNPTTVTLSGTAATTVSVSIGTQAAAPAAPVSPYMAKALDWGLTGIGLAFLPLGLLAFSRVRRRASLLRGTVFLFALSLAALAFTGCSGSTPSAPVSPVAPVAPTTPPASVTSQVVITATAGAITHTTTVALTVQ